MQKKRKSFIRRIVFTCLTFILIYSVIFLGGYFWIKFHFLKDNAKIYQNTAFRLYSTLGGAIYHVNSPHINHVLSAEIEMNEEIQAIQYMENNRVDYGKKRNEQNRIVDYKEKITETEKYIPYSHIMQYEGEELGVMHIFFSKDKINGRFRKSIIKHIIISTLLTSIIYTLFYFFSYRSLYINALEGLFQAGSGGHFEKANKSMARIMGYDSPGDLIRSINSIEKQCFCKKSDYLMFCSYIQKQEAVNAFETRFYKKNKEVIWVSLNVKGVIDSSGKIISFEGSVLDITERREREEAEREKEKATFATRMKSEFLASMSHEIRTPMNAVIGLSQLALRTGNTEKHIDYIEKIHSSAQSLLGIINDILDFERIEAGKLKIEYTPFKLENIFTRLSNLVEVKCINKGLELIYDINDNVPLFLTGDPLRLLQVLTNLTNNAVKFTDAGTITITAQSVEEKLSDSDGKTILCFSVSDTGIGMTPEQMEKLFDAFTQADVSITRKYGGSGLGLSICKHLVQLMGGAISAESQPGKGSKFTFTISFEEVPEHAQLELLHSDRQNHRRIEGMDKIRGARILLVEDNEINRQVATDLLESENFVVEQVENGREAVIVIAKALEKGEKTYDAVLMDIQMPVMDGYTATHEIRNLEKSQPAGMNMSFPVIAMTANAMPEERNKCLETGMNDYIMKPIDIQALFNALVRWIEPGERNIPLTAQKKTDGNRDAGLPETLPGINVASGVERSGGSRNAFRKTLFKFYRSNIHMADEIAEAISAGDIKAVSRMAHLLKGIAGNIGAEELCREAAVLENRSKDEGCENLREVPETFTNTFNIVMNSIKELEKQCPETSGTEHQSARTSTGNTHQIESLVTELSEWIEVDITEARDRIDNLMKIMDSTQLAEDTRMIHDAIEEYDLEGAKVSLDNFRKKLADFSKA